MEMISKEEIASYKKSDSYQQLRKLRNEGLESLQGYYEKYKDKRLFSKKRQRGRLPMKNIPKAACPCREVF